jgi:hypothetical protein
MAPAQDFVRTPVVSGLSRPVFVTHAPGDTSRIFIVEQRGHGGDANRGAVRIFDLDTGTLLSTSFLEIDGVSTASEQGLLGFTFHPDYAANGRCFVNYTSGSQSNIVEFRRSAGDPNVADPTPVQTIITYAQPFDNHNSGWLSFGPDGYLWLPTGDGGSGNDPGNRAQTLTNPLGKILRIDVDGDDFPGDANLNYAIPADNPFDGVNGLREVWALGLRNAWRNAWDPVTGELFIADVGQSAREEINIIHPASVTPPLNFGWRCMEGTLCTGISGCTCNSPGLTLPIHEYSHSFGCSITGGEVLRDCSAPYLDGTYFFADYCSGRVWTLRRDAQGNEVVVERTSEMGNFGGNPVSFGKDALGRIYLCSLGGSVHRIDPVVPCPADWDGSGGTPDSSDFLAYLNSYAGNDRCADLAPPGGNGSLDSSDFLAYLNLYAGGC